jgi:hypothetical protein
MRPLRPQPAVHMLTGSDDLRRGSLLSRSPPGHSGPPRWATSALKWPRGMTSGRGWRGCPPGTTLSRNRRGHSSPPRDGGLALRRISPEDTGPGRAPPPTPPSPLWHRPPRSKTQSRPRIRTYLIDGWRVGVPKEMETGKAKARCPRSSPRGEVGGGGGMPPRSRIFWGASSKRETKFSWRARVAPRVATQRGGPRRLPPPPPAELPAVTGHAAGTERERFHAVS